MKWVLIGALGIAGLVLLVVVIGALLPQKHKVSRTVSLHHTAEAVWNLISGPPSWRPDVVTFRNCLQSMATAFGVKRTSTIRPLLMKQLNLCRRAA